MVSFPLSAPTPAMSFCAHAAFTTLQVALPAPGVLLVQLHRPRKLNAMDGQMFIDIGDCFRKASQDADVRVVILASSSDRVFTAGLDLKEIHINFPPDSGDRDAGRTALKLQNHIRSWQQSLSAIEDCMKPVIAVINSQCIGGGMDLISCCDMRFCTADASFSIKEVDIGLAADLGTIQRLPKIVGNQSLVREWCFTGRKITATEALTTGLVSRVCTTRQDAIDQALELAKTIAEKSPIAITGTKHSLVYSRDHSVKDGLAEIAKWNSIMLQSQDVAIATLATLQKTSPKFAKL